MRASNRLGQLAKQWLLDLGKLGGIHDLEDIFDLIQEHYFLCAVHLRPIAEEAEHNLGSDQPNFHLNEYGHVTNLLGQRSILLQKLNNTVGQLRVIHAETLHLMERNQYTSQEQLMLLLEWQGKAVDNGT